MNSRLVSGLFFIGRHFGTGKCFKLRNHLLRRVIGVILATAFAHLLQDAFENLAKAGPGWRQVAGVATYVIHFSLGFPSSYYCLKPWITVVHIPSGV